MATDKKFSDWLASLPVAQVAAGDMLPIVQGGVTKSAPVEGLGALGTEYYKITRYRGNIGFAMNSAQSADKWQKVAEFQIPNPYIRGMLFIRGYGRRTSGQSSPFMLWASVNTGANTLASGANGSVILSQVTGAGDAVKDARAVITAENPLTVEIWVQYGTAYLDSIAYEAAFVVGGPNVTLNYLMTDPTGDASAASTTAPTGLREFSAALGGAIVDYDSNGNGSYIRFANGIQVAWTRETLTYASVSLLSYTWAYPAAFINAPAAIVVTDNLTALSQGSAKHIHARYSAGTISATSVRLEATHDNDGFVSGDTLKVDAIAIGRWK